MKFFKSIKEFIFGKSQPEIEVPYKMEPPIVDTENKNFNEEPAPAPVIEPPKAKRAKKPAAIKASAQPAEKPAAKKTKPKSATGAAPKKKTTKQVK